MIRGGRGWRERGRTVKQRKWGTRHLEPHSGDAGYGDYSPSFLCSPALLFGPLWPQKERKQTKRPVTGGHSSPEMPHPRSEEGWVLRVRGRPPLSLLPSPSHLLLCAQCQAEIKERWQKYR